MVHLRICEKVLFFGFNESTDNSVVESLAWIIFHELCLGNSWKPIEVFYFNQIKAGIEIFDNKNCQVIFGFEYLIKQKVLTDAGNRTRAAWVRTRNPNH